MLGVSAELPLSHAAYGQKPNPLLTVIESITLGRAEIRRGVAPAGHQPGKLQKNQGGNAKESGGLWPTHPYLRQSTEQHEGGHQNAHNARLGEEEQQEIDEVGSADCSELQPQRSDLRNEESRDRTD